jgi:hypothetical protein
MNMIDEISTLSKKAFVLVVRGEIFGFWSLGMDMGQRLGGYLHILE